MVPESYINHKDLREWVNEVAALTQPTNIYLCDGSDFEWENITEKLVASGTFVR